MAKAAIEAAWERAGDLDRALVDDIILGCAFPEGSQGLNVARSVALLRRVPGLRPGHDGQPVLLLRAAGDRPGVRARDLPAGRM